MKIDREQFIAALLHIEECVEAHESKPFMIGVRYADDKMVEVRMNDGEGGGFDREYSWDDLDKGVEHFRQMRLDKEAEQKRLAEEKKRLAEEKKQKQRELERNERYKQYLELKKEFNP